MRAVQQAGPVIVHEGRVVRPSQLIRSVGRTMVEGTQMGKVLGRTAVVLILATAACAPTPPPSVPEVKWSVVVRYKLTTMRGTFRLPPGCQADCRFMYDEWFATATCSDLPTPILYRSSFEKPPLSPTAPGVSGRDVADGAPVVWGWADSVDAWFCAVLTDRPPDFKMPASHSWCALSPDGLVKARVLEIARSFRAAPADVPNSFGSKG